MKSIRLRSSSVALVLLGCGALQNVPVFSAGPHASDSVQEETIFQTFVLFLVIATDDYAERSSERKPLVEVIGFEGEDRRNLVALTKEAYQDSLAFDRYRTSVMCAKSGEIQTREQLADEYTAYAADLRMTQIRLAGQILDRLDQPVRAKLLSYRDTWFIRGTKRISGDDRDAIMKSADSASGLLQKICQNSDSGN